jgi:hypothetical protein
MRQRQITDGTYTYISVTTNPKMEGPVAIYREGRMIGMRPTFEAAETAVMRTHRDHARWVAPYCKAGG